jgi:hypothetical protein
MRDTIRDRAAVYGNAAQIASAVFALLGFGVVLFQLNEIYNSNRATSARQVYLAYMDLEFRYPQFATPDYQRIKAGAADELSRYESFVSYLLYACVEALVAFRRQRHWHNTCVAELRPHLPYLCEKAASDPKYLTTYGDQMISFIRAAMSDAGVAAPECRVKGS